MARTVLSLPAISRLEPIWILRMALAVLLVGSLVAWVSTGFALSFVGFSVIGLGSGVLFPLGVALEMDTSPCSRSLLRVASSWHQDWACSHCLLYLACSPTQVA